MTTLQEIVATMERRDGRADRIWVGDRGMVSADNIAFLKQSGRRYIIGTPEELIIDFGLNSQPSGTPTEPIAVQRVVTNDYTAKEADASRRCVRKARKDDDNA